MPPCVLGTERVRLTWAQASPQPPPKEGERANAHKANARNPTPTLPASPPAPLQGERVAKKEGEADARRSCRILFIAAETRWFPLLLLLSGVFIFLFFLPRSFLLFIE
ncbi:MAG: hypothetical protein BGN96_15785 [Bacteroidales bacterium 45-6]|nr:MAG: hypothetical protein BGN96_15785 [Bacteroidales bacterium 45-6]